MDFVSLMRAREQLECLMFGMVSNVVTAYLLGEEYKEIDLLSNIRASRSPLMRDARKMNRNNAKLCVAAGFAGQMVSHRIETEGLIGVQEMDMANLLQPLRELLLGASGSGYFARYCDLVDGGGFSTPRVAAHHFTRLSSKLESELIPLADLIVMIAQKIMAVRGVANWEQLSQIIVTQTRELKAASKIKTYEETILRLKKELDADFPNATF